MTVRPSLAARTKSSPPDRISASAGHPDGPLHVGHGDAAVGPIDDHRQPLAAAESDGHVAQLDGGPDGRHVRGDRHEDAVGVVEDRLVERAVGGVQVDDDDVDAAARR